MLNGNVRRAGRSEMVTQIPLSRGRFALVDDADAPLVSMHKWSVQEDHHTAYAKRKTRRPDGRQTPQSMHAFLTGFDQTDHINGDGLDNRRENLRQASDVNNARNQGKIPGCTSRFKGVDRRPYGRWRARIRPESGAHVHLGNFVDEEEAARAYDRAARELFGEFAAVNFPVPGERPATTHQPNG